MTNVRTSEILTRKDLDLIIQGLGERPYNEVFRVMIKLKQMRRYVREMESDHEEPVGIPLVVREAIPPPLEPEAEEVPKAEVEVEEEEEDEFPLEGIGDLEDLDLSPDEVEVVKGSARQGVTSQSRPGLHKPQRRKRT